MTDAYTFHNGVFQHIILEGYPYQAGFIQGELLRGTPQANQAMRDADVEYPGFASFASLQAIYEALCPGITEELQGFADALGVSVERLAFY